MGVATKKEREGYGKKKRNHKIGDERETENGNCVTPAGCVMGDCECGVHYKKEKKKEYK